MGKLSRFVRVAGIAFGGLVAIALAGWLVASSKASAKLSQHFDAHAVEIPLPHPLTASELTALRAERGDSLEGVDVTALATERAVARGKHLVDARYGCNVCHGANLAGGVMIDDPAIGTIRGPNLTGGKGGVVARYSMSDWDRIVRHGLKPDGSPAIMPSEDYFSMTDRELSDIVAYIRSRPAVDVTVDAPTLGPVGKVLLAVGKLPLSAEKLPDHHRAHAAEPPAAADTPEFGAHLAATCTGCHRSNLAGGPMTFGPPGWPAAANLTPHATGLAGWSFEDFDRSLTQGVSKDGRALREPMTHVLPGTRAMTPTERKAMWTYLQSLAAQPMNP